MASLKVLFLAILMNYFNPIENYSANPVFNYGHLSKNLSGLHLRAAKLIDDQSDLIKSSSAFNLQMLQLLQHIHNFTFSIRLINANDIKSSELISGLLSENQVDLSIALAPATGKMATFAFYRVKFGLFYRPPQISPIDYLRPFQRRTWLAICFISILVLIAVQISFRLSRVESPDFAALLVFASFCQQGTDPFPASSLSCRLIFLILLLMSNLIFNYHGSILVALLLQPQSFQFQSVEQMKGLNYEISYENKGNVAEWIEYFQDSANSMKNYSLERGIARVNSGYFAYLTDTCGAYRAIAKTFEQNAVCDFGMLQTYPTALAGIMARKNATFRKVFQISLVRLLEIGLVHRLRRIYEYEKPLCYGRPDLVAAGMKQAQFPLIFLALGAVVSLLFLLIEIWRGK